MVVGAVEARAGKARLQPAEQRLVADVHAQRDLRLLPVAAEVALADQDAHDEAPLDVAQLRLRRVRSPRDCFTVMKNVKRRRAPAARRGASSSGETTR